MRGFDLRMPGEPGGSCPVRVGPGALDALAESLLIEPPGRPLVVVSDSHVAPLYGETLVERLVAGGATAHLLSFPAGEAHKTRETKATLEDALFELGAGRRSAIVALGGGVVGDMAGFVAATWQRGVPVVQAPTSLLAMVDAALGGKTGLDLPGGKNFVGAFHQPVGLYADISTLETLPEATFRGGFAEVVKSAVIADAGLFRELEQRTDELLARDPDALAPVVERCLAIKGRVVRADFRESGRRAVLNFGHTVAHALETVSGYGIPHGDAVAIGMTVEAELAVGLTGLSRRAAGRIARLLRAFGLPTRWPEALDPSAAVEAATRDKKSLRGEIRCALPRAVGRMLPGSAVTSVVERETLLRAVASADRR